MNLSWQFACALVFGIACWGLGDLLFLWFYGHKSHVASLARHTLSFALGNVTFSYLLTVLGFSGLFIPSVFWAVFICGIGLSIWLLCAAFRNLGLRGFFESWQKTRGKRFPVMFLVISMFLFFLPAILQAAAPPYVRDSLVYHLLCPKEYLRASRLIHIPGNIFSAFPKGHEVLMTLLLSVSGDRAAQFFGIFQQAAAVCSLYSVASLLAGPWVSVFCTLGYGTIPPVIYFSGCGYVESALLMALGSGLMILSLYLRTLPDGGVAETLRLSEIALMGLLSGWMVAVKYNGLIYFGLIGLILLWSQRRERVRDVWRTIGTFTIAASPGFSWMVWNWVNLGNPVYPMGWFLFGGNGWDQERALAMSLYFDHYGMGKSLADYIKLPWRLAFLGRFDSTLFDGSTGPFLILFSVLGVISIFLVVRRRLFRREMGVFGFLLIVSASFFIYGTQQARFWLPSQFLLCVFAASGLDILMISAKSKEWIKRVLVVIVIVSLSWNMQCLVKQVYAAGYYKPVLGLESDWDFLARRVPGYPAIEFINSNLAGRTRIFCIWTGAYGYYLNRPYYSDTFLEDSTLKKFIGLSHNGKEMAQRLSMAGFTHVFFQVSVLIHNMSPEQQAVFVDFLREGAAEIFTYQDYWIFKIHTDRDRD
jgi:hypothetical protein